MGIRKTTHSLKKLKQRANLRDTEIDADIVQDARTQNSSLEKKIPPKKELPTVEEDEIKVKKAPPRKKTKTRTTAKKPPSSFQADGEKTQIYLTAYIPEPGISESFDLLSKHYTQKKALRLILRKAMSEFDNLIHDGSFKNRVSLYKFAKIEGKEIWIQTSRIMPQALLEETRAYFDPLGFESERAFGQMLATAALAAFFDDEKY